MPGGYFRGGIPVVKVKDIYSGRIDESNLLLAKPSIEEPYKRSRLNQGDVLITIRGTTGRVAIVPQSLVGANITQDTARLRPNNRVRSAFLFHVLQSKKSQQQVALQTIGQAVKGINIRDVKELIIPVPALPEQEAIANALSDADAYIESLEKLIAKRRLIKKGVLQELLTGKRRLPGFSGEWKDVHLKDVCWFQEGPGVRTHQFRTSGVKLLNGTNISLGELNLETTTRFISTYEAFGAYAHFLADAGDIVIASSGITIDRFHEKVAFVRESDLPLCMNTSTIRFKPIRDRLSASYLFQYLMSLEFKAQIGGQATGSAQLNFGPSHVNKVEMSLPDLSEQQEIADMLTDLDLDLRVNEQKLTKARLLKQGMMQELLTGRIRLI